MASPLRKAEDRDLDRREEILDAATRLFAELGYDGADTQRLADDLGVGKGTLYRHFPSKRDLFLAAADRAMEGLRDRVNGATEESQDPLEKIALAIGAYLDYFDENAECVELLIQERAQFKDRPKPTYFEHRGRSVARWREVYRSLMEEGRLREMPVERISDVITAAVYGAMFLKYFGGRSESFSATAEDILDVVFFGILSDTERRRSRARGGEPPTPGPVGNRGGGPPGRPGS
jgi:AcrR family transcriptional regulator